MIKWKTTDRYFCFSSSEWRRQYCGTFVWGVIQLSQFLSLGSKARWHEGLLSWWNYKRITLRKTYLWGDCFLASHVHCVQCPKCQPKFLITCTSTCIKQDSRAIKHHETQIGCTLFSSCFSGPAGKSCLCFFCYCITVRIDKTLKHKIVRYVKGNVCITLLVCKHFTVFLLVQYSIKHCY